MISNETIKEFQKIIELKFSIILSEVEAKEILHNWTSYFDLLAKIDNRQKL